jgi:hypothetical protein
MKSFFTGMLGGITIISIILLFFLFSSHFYTYKLMIINPNRIDSLEKYQDKIHLIKDLQKDNLILTPQEYADNVVSYYNTAFTILIFLFILFSFVSYFHLKFLSKEQIHKTLEDSLKDSKKFEEIIMSAFAGKADDKYATQEQFDELNNKIETLRFNEDEPNNNQIDQPQN